MKPTPPMKADKINRIFVYCTLLRGECHHHFLHERAALFSIRPAQTQGTLIDLGL